MATWPRWVDDATVDSAAMLEGYLYVRNRLPEEERDLLWLTTENHDDGIGGPISRFSVTPPGIVEIDCKVGRVGGCTRCTGLRGGYKFRWYHESWYERYAQNRRPGAWARQQDTPPEADPGAAPEAEPQAGRLSQTALLPPPSARR